MLTAQLLLVASNKFILNHVSYEQNCFQMIFFFQVKKKIQKIKILLSQFRHIKD